MMMIYISYIRKHNGQKRPITVYDYIITNRKNDIVSVNEKRLEMALYSWDYKSEDEINEIKKYVKTDKDKRIEVELLTDENEPFYVNIEKYFKKNISLRSVRVI